MPAVIVHVMFLKVPLTFAITFKIKTAVNFLSVQQKVYALDFSELD